MKRKPADKIQMIIYGASRHGSVVFHTLRAGGLSVFAFVDDDLQLQGRRFQGLPVYPGWDWIAGHVRPEWNALVAIGSNPTRVRLAQRLRSLGMKMANAIHPSAVVMDDVQMETDVFVGAGAVLVSGTVVRDDVVVNTGTSVDHDSLLEQGAYLSPGVCTAGCVTIRKNAFIGAGAVIGPGVVVGEGGIVGAGSVVLKDVTPGMLVYGNPAKIVGPVPETLNWSRLLAGKKAEDLS